MRNLVMFLAIAVLSTAASLGQGQFNFNNRVVPNIDAPFVLASDPPGSSSVAGADFQVQFFAGALGAPIDQLQPTEPSTLMPFLPGLGSKAGYTTGGFTITVPNTPGSGNPNTSVLMRAFEGPSWDTATYRFQGLYSVLVVVDAAPQNLPLGTSQIVLQSVPEPSTLVLTLVGLGGFVLSGFVLRRRIDSERNP